MLSRNRGFTLLELLMVVIILAAITLYGVYTLRQSVRLTVAEQVSVEMQNVLIAERNYYVNSKKKKWSTNLSDLVDDGYLPEHAVCSPLPGNESFRSCTNKALYKVKANDRYLEVSVQTPSEEIATQIAQTLPMSKVTGSKVSSVTPIPSVVTNERALSQQTLNNSQIPYRGWISSAGVVKSATRDGSGDKIYLPDCPNGFEGHYMLHWFSIDTGHIVDLSLTSAMGKWPYMKYQQKDDLGFNSKGEATLLLNAQVNQNTSDLHEKLFYTTFCLPEGNWFPGGGQSSGTSRTKQCGERGWLEYNRSNDLPDCDADITGPI